LTIGRIARRSGFSIKALRFYERRGLPKRNDAPAPAPRNDR
jgi:DNA-binding transcriptional MerR regulator